MNNIRINFTSNQFAKRDPQVSDEKTVSKPIDPFYDEDFEDNSFEGTAERSNQESRAVTRNFLIGSLLAMSAMATPFAIDSLLDDEFEFSANPTEIVDNKDKHIIDMAHIYAKNGKDSTILEPQEFDMLIDYSKLNEIPKLTRENIKMLSKAGVLPIDTKSFGADEKILAMVKDVQYYVNSAAERWKENPPKSSMQNYYEYCMKYITDEEILENVDFSELLRYQSDITLVKHGINATRERIKRDDIDAYKKKQKAIENAQKVVDTIVARYNTRAKVSGNSDGNTTLTEVELLSLLNLENIEDLPYELKIGIVKKALEGYTPRNLTHVVDDRGVEFENRMIDNDVKKSQKILDEWTAKARKEFGYAISPEQQNQIILVKRD